MDVWIIAAAAGAGFVARRFKKLTMGKCKCTNLSSAGLEIAPESLGNVKCKRAEAFHNESVEEIASTSGSRGESLLMLDDFWNWGIIHDSNSVRGPLNNEDITWDLECRLHSGTDEDITCSSMAQPSSSEVGFSYGFKRHKSSLRSRRFNSKFSKPWTSLESCLMAQLYKEHAEMEECSYYVHSPQIPIVRPFLVTDRSRVIGRPLNETCSKQIGTGNNMLRKNNTHIQENRTVFCLPRLPNAAPVELQMRDKAKSGKDSVLVKSNTGKMMNKHQDISQVPPERSSSDGALLLYLGLTMGITYSSLQHKLELEKLRSSLKQTEDLVQNLQEELEMNDASTVKEIAVEDYESLDVHNDSYFDDTMQALSPEQKLDSSSRHCYNDEYYDSNSEGESLRKMEAELEAELDRLASNINTSRLEEKPSNVTEINSDLISDVIEGDLRADLFGAKTGITQAYADRNSGGTSATTTTHPVHYPVSPRELSLRLHQVIQSRLEERVKELEMALEQSQMKTKCMRESDSTQSADQPVVINLSREAQSAYNEAFEELTKLSESDEEEEIKHHHQVENDFGLLDSYVVPNGSPKMSFSSRQEVAGHVNLSNDVLCNSRDESEDEMERLLIKQIVEKARQGSPAVLRVQRALLSCDENYNWHQMGTQ
ncbi:hypothetical protein OROMI_003421 [Orobanche minor]